MGALTTSDPRRRWLRRISEFRVGLEERELQYVVQAKGHTSAYAERVPPKRPDYAGMGRPPKPRYREKPSSLRALALEARSEATVEISWREGTTGELHSRFLALQVRLANIGLRNRANRQGSELPARWLLCEWPEDASEPVKYWLSNLSEQTLLLKLVRLAKLRWRIEHDYHELKDALGLDHFEGRSYRGWNHHVTLVSIAHAYPHPGTHSPETQGSSLSLFALARELQALLACWQGTCPTCRRELPPNHPPRPPPT